MRTAVRFLGIVSCAVVTFAVMLPVSAAEKVLSVAQEFDANYAYVAGSRTKQGSTTYGSLTEQQADIKYVVSPQLSKNVLLRFGAEWQRYSFGNLGGAPVPSTLQQINAVIGLDYQLADQWLLRVELQPGIYSDFQDITSRDLDAPLVIGASFLKDADLQYFFGLLVDVRSQYPVLPAVGVRWQFADEWILNLLLPHPRLEFAPTDRHTFYLGADINVGTYTVGNNFGTDHGQPKLNNAVMDYAEIRLGPGLAWKAAPTITVELEGGYMVHREFRFWDQDTTLRNSPAPYAQLACRARF